jgi:hypothetical protein
MKFIDYLMDFLSKLFCTKSKKTSSANLGEKMIPKIENKIKIISIDCPLYLQPTPEFKTPFLDIPKSKENESSTDNSTVLHSIFGSDIQNEAIKKLMFDIQEQTVPLPLWQVTNNLTSNEGAFHDSGCIYVNENFILKAEKSPENAWTLFRVMIEEIGHYVDYLLRNKYDTLHGDAKGDEGTRFANAFIYHNKLLQRDFHFANFHVQIDENKIESFRPVVLQNMPNEEEKAKTLLYTEDATDDQAAVMLNNGKQIIGEFFKIRGGGAIHENLTLKAANAVNIVYDYRLDEGCAWPDVPCENENSIETCYFNTWRNLDKPGTFAYESHHGRNQYWHSMAPTGEYTNQEVIELIITQAKKWFTMGVNTGMGDGGFWNKAGDDGLFHIGKILHMIQDSFSSSHIQRNKQNKIIQIQGYNEQDARKHGKPDKEGHSKGANDAQKYSAKLLTLYKVIKSYENSLQTPNIYLPQLEALLRDEIYMIQSDRRHIKAGGTLDAYANERNG